MSESEYEAARSSTLTAFYTPATVIHPIYRALERFGVKGGKILEPSMGTGAFLAHGHFGSSDAKFYGVELDSITGRISKQLYQKANIQVTGYENALLPDNYFDCVIGNVPFGNFQVNDPQYNRLHFPIHDYFFAKSIDKLRTGGIMAFITSSGTLDKKDDRTRKYIAERCDLIGAVRLPNNAFKGSGTKIMTDVIFLQKRDTLRQQDEPWLHLAEDANGITMNRYFVEHPEMICGRMEIVSGPYGPTSTCQPIDPDAVDRFGKPLLETQIDTAMQHLTATLTKAEIPVQEESGEDTKYIDADPFVRNFSYTVKDDKIYYREGAVMRECNPNAASAERIRKLVELRDTTRALIDAQLQDLSDEEIHRLQGQLNRQYDAFRAKHGLINSRSAELSFRDDSSYYLLCSLENVDEKGNFISKSDMFTKRTIRSAQIPDHADTASDALALSMAYTKIIKVKSNLNLCLDYTSNPMKTERRSAEDLNKLLNYTQNNDKTEHQLYVSGFNCIPQNAYEIMMETKTRWRKPVKDGNILAYHIIQSFAPGEATPDQVHQIGCEFVQRFLADRFECTVSTHLDRGHLHNHIVVNSVSYADGRMFRSDFNTYYKGIRKTSDELCRENRLSVIETDGKGKSYDEWLSGRTGKPTIRGMVRKDVEQAIAAADSFDGFITELQNMGYTVKYGPRVEHMAVRHKDAQRNIRIDRLDPRFSETALREYYHKLHRMPTEMQQEYRQENAPAKPQWQPTELQPPVQRVRYRGKLPRRYPKVSGFMACYYHYCALLRKAYHGKATKRCYFLLREDFLLFSRYQQQTKFLWENHIETMDELLAYKENAEVQIQQLARQRKVLYRQKHEPERAAREEKIKSLTQQMKVLRHEVYICSDIETDAAEVQEKLRQAELAAQEERNEVKQDEQRRRSSRSDGAGSLTGYRGGH